jgi:hypothetical protein
MPNICIICHRTSRKFKDINFIPFPKKFEIREKWSKALKLTENDLKASSRVCSFRSMFGFNALGTLSPDDPTSIFSTLLSSDTGKLVTSGWGDFWEVVFIFFAVLLHLVLFILSYFKVGSSGDNVPSALNPNIDLIAKIN